MPYTMEDFRREVAREYLKKLTPEERLAAEARLAGLPPDEIEAYLKRLRKVLQSPASGTRRASSPKVGEFSDLPARPTRPSARLKQAAGRH